MSYNISLNNAEVVLTATPDTFEPLALSLFHYQYEQNALYHAYCDALHIDPHRIKRLTDIPFLPISFFKTNVIATGGADTPPALLFESSGTTGDTPSRHYVRDARIYERSLLQGFEQFYGDPGEYTILALLPSYLERGNASLVHMARVLMEKSARQDNGFYINEWDKLSGTLQRLEQSGQKILLLGVTFALLDFAAAYPMKLSGTVVMETGGMKGRRAELTRSEVHQFLQDRWQLKQIHAEYGMTELLSQAYAIKDGIFGCCNTMRVLIRDINDPLDVSTHGSGCINIIDLANVHSCAFIATEDIGAISSDGSFEVLGRMDHSALRGCSLMAV